MISRYFLKEQRKIRSFDGKKKSYNQISMLRGSEKKTEYQKRTRRAESPEGRGRQSITPTRRLTPGRKQNSRKKGIMSEKCRGHPVVFSRQAGGIGKREKRGWSKRRGGKTNLHQEGGRRRTSQMEGASKPHVNRRTTSSKGEANSKEKKICKGRKAGSKKSRYGERFGKFKVPRGTKKRKLLRERERQERTCLIEGKTFQIKKHLQKGGGKKKNRRKL